MIDKNIIGSGFIATSFLGRFNYNDAILFASGISNSNINILSEFEREKSSIVKFSKNCKGKKFIYFSSCSVLDKSRNHKPYQKHKLDMEKTIIEKFENYLILRLPEVMGCSKNPHTLINFLINQINKKLIINTSHQCYRNLIDINEVVIATQFLIKNKFNRKIINIANSKMYKVTKIIETLGNILNKSYQLNFDERFSNKNFKIDTSAIQNINEIQNLFLDPNYLEIKLRKFYV